jgi:hypothetical protein
VKRGRAEKRRRSVVEKSFRKMGGRAFPEIVGMVPNSIPDGSGKSSRVGRTQRRINAENAESAEFAEFAEKSNPRGRSELHPYKGRKTQEHRQDCLCHVCLRERQGIWYATAHETTLFDRYGHGFG